MRLRTVMPFIVSIAVAAAPAQAFGASGKTAVIKNTLGEEISMAGNRSSQAKEEEKTDSQTMCKQIAVLLEKYVVGTIEQGKKTELQEKLKQFGKLNPEEKKQLMTEIDNSPILKLALDAFRESESGKPKLKEWLTAIISVNKAANDSRIDELVDRNNAVFVATIMMLRGDAAKAAEIIDGNAKATIFFFNYALQKVDGFAGALAFSETYTGLDTGLDARADAEKIKLAKEALNVRFKQEGDVLTEQAVAGIANAAGITQETAPEEVKPIKKVSIDLKPKDLAELEAGLRKGELKELYTKKIKDWLTAKVSGENAKYEIYGLDGLIEQIKRAAETERAANSKFEIDSNWLDQNLNIGTFSDYLKQKKNKETGPPII